MRENRFPDTVELAPEENPGRTTTRISPIQEPRVQLGRFRIEGELGVGGMARVFDAYDPILHRHVALKVPRSEHAEAPLVLERFAAETTLTAQLEHPNITALHESGAGEGGSPFFVMRKVEGRSLAELLASPPEQRGPWSGRRLLVAFVQVCHAISYAHKQGLIHRDIKPANIMLGDHGVVTVMDWGMACRVTDPGAEPANESPIPDEGVVGTPGYMAPEQLEPWRGPTGPRTDIFALGAVLYEILTGEQAYEGGDAASLVRATLEGPPRHPSRQVADGQLSQELVAVVYRAMATDPRERYQQVEDLVEAVERHLDGERSRRSARHLLDHAEDAWRHYEASRSTLSELAAREQTLEERLVPWAPVDDPVKVELRGIRRELVQLRLSRALRFDEAVGAAQQALGHVPESKKIRTFLSRAYWSRMHEAEAAGDATAVAYLRGRVHLFDDGAYGERLRQPSTVSLRTAQTARVFGARVQTQELVWRGGEEQALGETPLRDVELRPGSWVLRIEAEGVRDTILPVRLERGERVNLGEVALFEDTRIGADYAYVPAGPAWMGEPADLGGSGPDREEQVGGFFMQRTPVTAAQYLEFLKAVARTDPEKAAALRPRREGSTDGDGGPYWPEITDELTLPFEDPDGDAWLPDQPVFSVTWSMANEYARWRSRVEGRSFRLPTEREWVRAARGADTRRYPWGDDFDPALCANLQSMAPPPRPVPVGSHEHDRSCFGVMDLAGGVRDWCADGTADGMRAVRGGGWCTGTKHAAIDHRFEYEEDAYRAFVGFRLVEEVGG